MQPVLPDDAVSAYLLGFCGGLNADGRITEFEAGALLEILRGNPAYLAAPILTPHQQILGRLLQRDILYKSHYSQVRQVVLSIVGVTQESLEASVPDLVFDSVLPGSIAFSGMNVVVTGDFNMGRGGAEEIVSEMGAILQSNTNGQTDYVIVGDIPTPSWKFGKYGNKVARALELRDSGMSIRIISEDSFCSIIPVTVLQEKLASIPKLKVDGFVIVRGGRDMLKGPFSRH